MPASKRAKTAANRTSRPSGLLTLEKDGPVQMGFWVPNRVWATAKYLVPLRKHVERKKKAGELGPLPKAVREFKEWVTGHAVYRMWVVSMIDQANAYVVTLDAQTRTEIKGDGDTLWIKDYDGLFEILGEIVTTSPAFNTTAQVGTPMNGLLAIAMATEAGLALFHDATFNAQFKKVLDSWNAFLKSPASLDKLDIKNPEKPGSWISKAAHKAGVWDQMVHDPAKPGYGYDSWNAFFIRQFVKGARPFSGDPKKDVNIGCETTPWEYADDLRLESYFWVKDADYSLLDLFGGQAEWARKFEGGQLYQGFLSATHYHRWRAPLDGKLVRSWVQPGTYFAQRPTQTEDAGTWEGTDSQSYLGHVAARAIFVFEHPLCGYVALICIGMVEVSTCVIARGFAVGEGAKPIEVRRGEEIGHFEFGGSTHVMVFQKDKVDLVEWAKNAVQHQNDANPMKLGSVIASAK